jgi:hypothetical protein
MIGVELAIDVWLAIGCWLAINAAGRGVSAVLGTWGTNSI